MKKLKLGSKILYMNKVCTILGFNYNLHSCVIEGIHSGHRGDLWEYWHDEKGHKIPYVAGKDDRWYVPIVGLVPIETQEPEFIFNI
jgi:hypothetical protein